MALVFEDAVEGLLVVLLRPSELAKALIEEPTVEATDV